MTNEVVELSVCMIVRDEEDVLPRALECARDLGGELVVVDTGSRDASPRLAEAAGARVLHHAWTDDFSAARNAALDAATGRWIFVLDADETIDATTVAALRRLVARPADRAFRLRQRNYVDRTAVRGFVPNDGSDEDWAVYPGYLLARQSRLFPNRSDVRYRGAVHEEVAASLAAAGVPMRDLDLDIHHFGKVRGDAIRRRKQELYLRLGRAKVEASDTPQAWLELGVQLLEMGRDAESEAPLRRAYVGLEPESAERARALACLAKLELRRERFAEAESLLERELAWAGLWLDPWHVLAESMLRQGKNEIAATCLVRARRAFPGDPHLLRLAAGTEVALGRWAAAAKLFADLWAALPGDAGAWRGLAVARLASGAATDPDDPLRDLGPAPGGAATVAAAAATLRRLGLAHQADRLEGANGAQFLR